MKFPFTLPTRYAVGDERREGGQGYVYICEDTFLQRKVAIKVMKVTSDPDVIKKEIASLSEIRSRHVVEVYDLVASKSSDMIGLVQEFVPGLDLCDHTKATDDADYLPILWQIACGLVDIHKHAKIHRDIKPANIRFDNEGVIKILDFGLAMDSADAITILARGTRYFLAPELYGTLPVSITQAVDVYAFGVVAWYLAQKGKLAPAMRTIPPGSPSMPSFSTVGVTLPPEVVSVLNTTLSISPALRPQMQEVRRILEQYLLYGKHRAYVSYGSQSKTLNSPGEEVTLKVGRDSVKISYDGVCFKLGSVSGDVYINNMSACSGEVLPGSCVITLGRPTLRYDRTFVPIDMSHPGVVI